MTRMKHERGLPAFSVVTGVLLAAWLLAGCAAERAATPVPASASSALTVAESARLPLDPAVRTGRLDNGLTYYVRRNPRPEKRAEMWLAVDAGSTLEDDGQQGLAHFCEHMAFNGTKHFKKQAIKDFLERAGMRFGPEINASTSFDETVYRLKVPTDDGAVVAEALAILEDWAHNISFDDADIERERGVIVEEWRQGRGAEARLRDKQLPVLFQGSRYAERLPIGRKEIIETASGDAIRRFYKDWYRPDLMAVIVVGDFDPAAMELQVRTRFSGLENPAAPRPRTLFPVPDHDETLISIATDPEATDTGVSVYVKLPRQGRATAADFRRRLVEQFYHAMINDRLDEIRERPDPPFLHAYSGAGSFVRTRDVVSQSAGVQETSLARGLGALLVELARVDRHGFNGSELERVKKRLLRSWEAAYRERDTAESGGFMYEILNLFLEGEPMPGIEFELALAQRLVPTVSLEELNGLARQWSGEKNRVILISGPRKALAALPAEDQVREIFRASIGGDPEPWVDRVRAEPLVPHPPEPGTIVEETTIAELGVTRWKLSNGGVVLLKPTDFKNDRIELAAFSPGGTSLVPDSDYVSAAAASQVLAEGGLGSFDQVELGKALAGKSASVFGFIGETEESVFGGASPQDVETLFQLIYLEFTAPRVDPQAVQAWKTRRRAALENRLAQPETVFSDAMRVALSQGHFRRRPSSVAMLDEIDLGRAESLWRERFGDAGDFTFGIVGAFKPAEIRPLVARWLGGLPSRGRVETWKDVGVRPPPGVVDVEVRKGLEQKSRVQLAFTGETAWTRESEHLLRSLGSALSIRLREVLREDRGGAYGVAAGGGIARLPVVRYSFGVSFGCSPQRVEELKSAVLEAIAAAGTAGFSEEIVAKVREQQVRERETALRENGFWLGGLLDAERFGDDPKLLLRHDELVRLVTADALRDTAQRFLDPRRLVTGVLLPETTPAAPSTAP
jgi:zinc protease